MTPSLSVLPHASGSPARIPPDAVFPRRLLGRLLRRSAAPATETPNAAGRSRRSEEILDDLRRLVLEHESVPVPPGWQAESVIHGADRGFASRDLLVAVASPDREVTDIVTVRPAAEQADESEILLLGAALTALVGAVPSGRLLPAVAGYLRRLGWTEPVAAAAVSVETGSGAYVLRGAGCYAAAQFLSGSGKWSVLPPPGGAPLRYGIADTDRRSGTLGRGDALVVLAPDVTSPSEKDLAARLDRLMGEVERVLAQGRGDDTDRLAHRFAASTQSPGTVLFLRRR